MRGGGVGGGRGQRGRVEGADYGAEVVDEGFAGAGHEEETAGQEPHGGVGEEAAGFDVQEPGLLAHVFVFAISLSVGFAALVLLFFGRESSGVIDGAVAGAVVDD